MDATGLYPPVSVLPSLSRLMKDGIGAGYTREAVSYTHLFMSGPHFLPSGVAFALIGGGLVLLFFKEILIGLVAVSYTHLDVYKRQS